MPIEPKKHYKRKPSEGEGEVKKVDDFDYFSGGNINAILVWREDGNVDLYDVVGKRIPSAGNAPKRPMCDEGVRAADIFLIDGDPKIIKINSSTYKL